jgi:hypothetical protein
MHSPTLSAVMAGWPATSVSAVGAVHWTVTQGCGPLGSAKVQPATMNWSLISATGVPLASTRRGLLVLT